jgi:hypothetical protein
MKKANCVWILEFYKLKRWFTLAQPNLGFFLDEAQAKRAAQAWELILEHKVRATCYVAVEPK